MNQSDIVFKIKEAVDIVSLMEQNGLPLSKVGGRYRGLCPFHGEKTPSFYVFPETHSYHCFGCKESGDVIDYLKFKENLSFPEALEKAARFAGLEHLLEKKNYSGDHSKNQRLYHVMELAAQFFKHILSHPERGKKGREFLAKRNIEDVADIFSLGFAPAGWEELKNFLHQKRVSTEEAFECGLLNESNKKANRFYDTYRERVIFPIQNSRKQIVAFGGRIITDDKTAKYINTKSTPIYKKGELLYGLPLAKEEIRKQDFVYIVEGYLDQISLFKNGIKNCVACLGTALTSQALSSLKPLSKKIYLLFDGDQAGLKATENSLTALLQGGFDAHVIRLPDGMDPDDYIKEHGKDALDVLRNSATPIFSFILKLHMNAAGMSTRARADIIHDFIPILKSIKDSVFQQLLVQEFCEHMDFEVDVIRRELNRSPRSVPKLESDSVQTMPSVTQKAMVPNTPFHDICAIMYLMPSEGISLFKEFNLEEVIQNCPSRELKTLGGLLLEKSQLGIAGIQITQDELNFYGFTDELIDLLTGRMRKLYGNNFAELKKQLHVIVLSMEIKAIDLRKNQLISDFRDIDRGRRTFLTDSHKQVEQGKLQEELTKITQLKTSIEKQINAVKRVKTD